MACCLSYDKGMIKYQLITMYWKKELKYKMQQTKLENTQDYW